MKLILFILSISSWNIVKVTSGACSHPEVSWSSVHIYRTADVKVTVYHCYYEDRNLYSDITKNCISAFKTGVYVDKWNEKNYINDKYSPVKLEKYTANANKMLNEIELRSGTVCRYDRGFCYDRRESTNYSAVWEVTNEEPEINADDLIEVFYNWINIWTLRNNSLKFLVFQAKKGDQSFALQLGNRGTLNAKYFWYTDRYGMIVSYESLKKIKPVLHLDQEYFTLRPKDFVSEQVLRKCDFQNFPLDFGKNAHQNYILDNIVTILGVFQEQLLETKKKLVDTTSGKKENSAIDKAITELQTDVRDTKTSLIAKDKEIVELRGNIQIMLNASSTNNLDISMLQEKIKQILEKQQGNDVEIDEIIEKLTVMRNQLSKLNGASNEKNISKVVAQLENNFTFLKNTQLEKNEEILEAFNSKAKLIDDIKDNLANIYAKIQNKNIELKKGQENTSNRVFNIELDLNRLNKNIMKFQNDTFLILQQKHTEMDKAVKGRSSTIELKYNSVLAKLNLHDIEISKCKNYTSFLKSSTEKLLDVVQGDIRETQEAVLKLEEKMRGLLNKDIALEQHVNEIDGITTELKENIERERQEFIQTLKNTNNEMKIINEKSEQCRRDIGIIRNSRDKVLEEVQRNLNDMKHKQDEDILMIMGILKEINDKFNANYKNFTEEIKNCKRSVNARLQSKDEEIKNIQENLIKKDAEIKKLQDYFKKIDEKTKNLEGNINKCHADTDRKLKTKDDEIKRIQDNLILREKEYEILKEEIKQIKEYAWQTVPSV